MSWNKCSDLMPPKDVNLSLICRSNGERIWPSNGYALNEIFVQNPAWHLKKPFIEWIPFTSEASQDLEGDKWNNTPLVKS